MLPSDRPGYSVITKNRKKKKRSSGGVAFLIKKQILPNIKKVENSDCNMADDLDILWVQFCSEKDNILLGLVYIPPPPKKAHIPT